MMNRDGEPIGFVTNVYVDMSTHQTLPGGVDSAEIVFTLADGGDSTTMRMLWQANDDGDERMTRVEESS
jgi:hypothetical protein